MRIDTNGKRWLTIGEVRQVCGDSPEFTTARLIHMGPVDYFGEGNQASETEAYVVASWAVPADPEIVKDDR